MDEQEIRELVLARAAAVGAKDAQAMVARHTPDLVAYTLAPPLRQPPAGRTAEQVETWLATFHGTMSMEIRDLAVAVSGDVAYCTSLNCLTATPVGQTESFSLWFRATLGLRKTDGSWVVAHEHESVPFEMDGSFQASIALAP